MKKAAGYSLLLITLLLTASTVQAEASSDIKINSSGNNVKVNIDSNVAGTSKSEVTTNSKTNIHISSSTGNNEVKIENDKFEIKGTINSVSGDSFEIGGQKIKKDSSLNITGSLETGKYAQTKGFNKSGELYATEIKTEGVSSSSNPSSTPTPSSSSSPQPSPSASSSVDSTNSSDVKVQASGPIEQVIDMLESILESLKKLL